MTFAERAVGGELHPSLQEEPPAERPRMGRKSATMPGCCLSRSSESGDRFFCTMTARKEKPKVTPGPMALAAGLYPNTPAHGAAV